MHMKNGQECTLTTLFRVNDSKRHSCSRSSALFTKSRKINLEIQKACIDSKVSVLGSPGFRSSIGRPEACCPIIVYSDAKTISVFLVWKQDYRFASPMTESKVIHGTHILLFWLSQTERLRLQKYRVPEWGGSCIGQL